MTKILSYDKVKHIRHIRAFQQTQSFQYVGTLCSNDILILLNKAHDLTKFNELRSHSTALKTIGIINKHCKHTDHYLFDLNQEHYDNLCKKQLIQLNTRLQYSCEYLNLSTQFSTQISNLSLHPKGNLYNSIPDIDKLAKELNIPRLDMLNFRMLSLCGSAKDIGRILNKSPRTVEKTISEMNKKYKIPSKQALQAYAKVISSHLTDFRETDLFDGALGSANL